MKAIAIFNEKGGTGKSTVTALFASWLAYEKCKQVAVLDFDSPSYQYDTWRRKELRWASEPGNELGRLASENPYPIKKVPPMSSGDMIAFVKMVKERNDGYLFLEFGGSFHSGKDDPSYVLLTEGLVDRLIIPVTTDEQTLDAAMYTVMSVRSSKKCRETSITLLWNNISGNERRSDGRQDWFSVAQAQFRALGADICGEKIRRNEILTRKANSALFVRNTLCWPKKNVKFMGCEYLETVFNELLESIDKQNSLNNNKK